MRTVCLRPWEWRDEPVAAFQRGQEQETGPMWKPDVHRFLVLTSCEPIMPPVPAVAMLELLTAPPTKRSDHR